MEAENLKDKDNLQDSLKDNVKDLTQHVGDYLDTFYKLGLVNITQKATNIASGAISAIIMCFLAVFVLLFAGFGAAWWLGDVVNSRAGGFFIMAGFYLLLALIVIANRKKLLFPFFRNLIIRKAYE